MRIGILTFHRSVNNGAVMQCYALSKRVRQLFPDATTEVIDYHMPKIARNYDASLAGYLAGGTMRIKLGKMINLLKNPGFLKRERKRNAVFEAAVNMLPLSEESIFDDGVQRLFAFMNDNYDVIIAGSDAIWNYNARGIPNPYFLDDSLKCAKLSYAASCYGMNYEKILPEQRSAIAKILDSYDFLGTRDDESQKFLQFIGCQKGAVHTCDPTVFLDVCDLPVDEEEVKSKLKKRGFDFERPAIGIMDSDRMCNMVRSFYGSKYQIVALYNYCKDADINLYDLTPFEWAFVFRYFKLVFTTFFHGTMLSLRNGTPVICVARETSYSEAHTTKVEDFLIRIGLQNCYFKTDYKEKNLVQIKEKADELLAKDCKADICARMDREAKTSEPFFEALAAIMEDKKRGEDI